MQALSLVNESIYYNLYTESGYAQGTTLVLHNRTADVLFLAHSATQPAADTLLCEYVNPDQIIVVHSNGLPVWVKGSTGPILVQAITEKLVAPFNVSDFPHDAYTSNKETFRRLRVDPGQTGFYEGREFRTFVEFNIPTNSSLWLEFTSPINFILFEQSLEVDAGGIRFEARAGATVTTPITTSVPIFLKNAMSSRPAPNYVGQITVDQYVGLTASPPITGGEVREVFRVVTVNATAQQRSVGGASQTERGLPATVFHLELRNISNTAATGVYSLFWEERP